MRYLKTFLIYCAYALMLIAAVLVVAERLTND